MTPAVLNFHGVGKPPPWIAPDEQPYWLSPDALHRTLDVLSETGLPLLVTFDDGNISDFETGVPACASRGIEVVCFTCTDRIGQNGYLAAHHLREIATWPGCTIGSHGRAHVDWRTLDAQALRDEAAGSRTVLENILDQPVTALGLPFGSYNRRVLRAAKAAGYTRIYSSDGTPRVRRGGLVPRVSIRADRDLDGQTATLIRRTSWHFAALQEVRLLLKERC